MSSNPGSKSARRCPHGGPRRVRLECEALETRVLPSAANSLFVTQVYHQLLGRVPDAGGAAGWINELDQGTSRTAVVRQIENTSEYRTDLLQAAYLHLLGRPADANGLASYLLLLTKGTPVEQIEASMAGSAEYFSGRAGNNVDNFIDAVYLDATGQTASVSTHTLLRQQLSQGKTRQQVAQDVFTNNAAHTFLVNNLYNDFLNRNADSAGMAYFVKAMSNGLRQEDVVADLVGSDEYYVVQVSAAGTPDQLFIRQIYQQLLNRDADPLGLNYWVAQLQQGSSHAQVVQEILDSQEGEQVEVERAFNYYLGRDAAPAELPYFFNLLATQGWEQLQANIAASPEYFQRQGGNTTVWIQGLTEEALGRPATSNEITLVTDEMLAGTRSQYDIANNLFTGEEYLQHFITVENQTILGSAVDAQSMANFESMLHGLRRPEDKLIPMLFAGTDFAEDVVAQQLGTVQLQTSAAFVQGTPANALVAGLNTNSLTYGVPGPFSPTNGQSRLQFLGGTLGGPLGNDLQLGWLQFTNRTTLPAGDLSKVTLQLSVFVAGAAAPVTVKIPLNLSNSTTTSTNATGSVTLASTIAPVMIPMENGSVSELQITGFRVGQVSDTTATSFSDIVNQTVTVALLGQVTPATLAPGIYLGTRTADTTEPGTHQFLIVVPQKPSAFPGLTQNLGQGVQGIVLGAHNVNGLLTAQNFAAADLQATQGFLNPLTMFSTFMTASNLKIAPVNLSTTGKSIDDNILALLAAVNKYNTNTSKKPLAYPAEDGALNPTQAWTDNSWLESILQYTLGNSAAPGSLSGSGLGAANRIAQSYFQ